MLNENLRKIILSSAARNTVIYHCARKLKEEYFENETPEKKAYGLLGGKIVGSTVQIEHAQPLYKNLRSSAEYRAYMDDILEKYAESSETPLARRGWVANPYEVKSMSDQLITQGLQLVGTYHMHRVAWENDLTRELPTTLDKALAEQSDLFGFIVSAVNPKKMIIRAFYESCPDREIEITTRSEA